MRGQCSLNYASRTEKDFSKVSTITRSVYDIGKHIEHNLKNRASEFIFSSLALNESTDITDAAQAVIFIMGADVHFNKTK